MCRRGEMLKTRHKVGAELPSKKLTQALLGHQQPSGAWLRKRSHVCGDVGRAHHTKLNLHANCGKNVVHEDGGMGFADARNGNSRSRAMRLWMKCAEYGTPFPSNAKIPLGYSAVGKRKKGLKYQPTAQTTSTRRVGWNVSIRLPQHTHKICVPPSAGKQEYARNSRPVWSSLMSAPLVKYPFAPVRTAATTDSLRAALPKSSANRENTALLKAFLAYTTKKEKIYLTVQFTERVESSGRDGGGGIYMRG